MSREGLTLEHAPGFSFDAVARFLFSAWQAYALAYGASSLLAIFLFFELAWGVAQVLPVRAPSRCRNGLAREEARPVTA